MWASVVAEACSYGAHTASAPVGIIEQIWRNIFWCKYIHIFNIWFVMQSSSSNFLRRKNFWILEKIVKCDAFSMATSTFKNINPLILMCNWNKLSTASC